MKKNMKRKSGYRYDKDKRIDNVLDKISAGAAVIVVIMLIITAEAAVNHETYANSDGVYVWKSQNASEQRLIEVREHADAAQAKREAEEKEALAEAYAQAQAEEETTAFETPVEDLGDPKLAAYEEQATISSCEYTFLNESTGTAAEDEFTLLCRMVRIEMGEGSGEEYYNACYHQAATALNRLNQGWAETLTEVLMMEGQYFEYGYHTWDWSQININVPDLQQAVLDCMAANDTPENLVFADSRHNHEGTENMEFYAEICGQDFYLSK